VVRIYQVCVWLICTASSTAVPMARAVAAKSKRACRESDRSQTLSPPWASLTKQS
jgi:hypothetical protein